MRFLIKGIIVWKKVFSPKLFGLIKDGSVKKNLSKDILAGIVVGIVALPLPQLLLPWPQVFLLKRGL